MDIVCWSACQLSRQLQSVLNAAARLMYHLKARDHITDALISLHWLRAPERMLYKTAVLTYKALHGGAPCYLSSLVHVADAIGRQKLRSAGLNHLQIPPFKVSTVCGQTFPVTASQFWNRLPDNVMSANSLSAFQQHLKHSVPAVIPRHYPVTFPNCNTHSGPSSGIAT